MCFVQSWKKKLNFFFMFLEIQWTIMLKALETQDTKLPWWSTPLTSLRTLIKEFMTKWKDSCFPNFDFTFFSYFSHINLKVSWTEDIGQKDIPVCRAPLFSFFIATIWCRRDCWKCFWPNTNTRTVVSLIHPSFQTVPLCI